VAFIQPQAEPFVRLTETLPTPPHEENSNDSSCLFSALAILVPLFPFRTAQFKVPGKWDSSASLGAKFVSTTPSKVEIFNAIFESDVETIRDDYEYSIALQSRVDYGRTLLLMAPFIAGALGFFFRLSRLE